MWAHSAALLTEAAGDLTPQLGVRSVATSSGNSTTIVANKPPHLLDGDVWEVWIGLPDQGGVVIDTPAGWVAQGTVDSLTPGGQFLACFTKDITDAAGESSTQSFTKSTSGTAADDQYEVTSVAVGDVGAGTGTVEAYDFAGLEDTAGSTQTTSSLTTGADGDVVLSAFVQDQTGSDGAWAASSPSGLRELSEEWTTSGNMGLAVYAEIRATAGSGTHSATQTTGGDNTRGSATGIIAFRFVSGGSVVTLEAAISTTPTISIEAAITRAVAASLSVVPTLSAQLAVTRAVAAALSPTPTVSGQIVVTRGLAASLSPTPTVTAEFNYIRTLAAVIAGSSTIAGDVSVQRAIAAAISTSPTVSANLVNQILLAASLSGTSTLSASLARLYVTLSASLAGSSTVNSDLSLVKLLEAAITTNPTLSAELVRPTVGLSADLTGQGTINANLNFAVLSLAAALAGTSTVTVEDFDRAVGFAAAISTTPTTSADLVAVRSLAASLAGGSSIDADTTVIISSFEALDASLTGGSVVTADMVRAYVQLSAAIACSASVSAEMSGGQEPYRELGMHGQMTARITALLEPFMAPERRKHGNS